VPVVLVAALLPVLLYCVIRALTPTRARGDAHHRDVDVWHVVLGLAMVAGLVGVSRGAALGVLAVSAVGVGWGILSVERRVGGGAYARLAVGAGAMAVMTLPMSLPLAAPAQAAPANAGNAMSMSGMGASDPATCLPLVGVLVVALVVAGASAAVVAVGRPPTIVRRLDACCDLVMAGVMAVMLVGVL
jgi:Domain of unknown function (DUF5134)